MESFKEAIILISEQILSLLSIASVLVIVIGLVMVCVYYVRRFKQMSYEENFDVARMQLAQVLVVALQILVLVDIIESITLGNTFESLLTLGLLLIARTWLSWTLDLESNGYWPWQALRKGKK